MFPEPVPYLLHPEFLFPDAFQVFPDLIEGQMPDVSFLWLTHFAKIAKVQPKPVEHYISGLLPSAGAGFCRNAVMVGAEAPTSHQRNE
jgi:hypothetical protein